MVWDHLCHIQFLSIHMKLAPAATSGALFCGELVGARKDAWHSNSRYCWFRARSQNLPSLCAFGGMVLVRQARQREYLFFATFIFAPPLRELTGGYESILLKSDDFGQGLEVCRVWMQSGPWCLHGGCAKTGRTGVLLHQVCNLKVCIWHT